MRLQKLIVMAFMPLMFIASQANAQYNVVVAKDGTGNYTSLQAAIDARPPPTVPFLIRF